MPNDTRWEPHILYSFLIANGSDEKGEKLPSDEFIDKINTFGITLKTALGGVTKIRVVEAEGDTAQWLPERTALLLTLAAASQQSVVDALIEREEASLTAAFGQDAIWITREELDVFKALREA